MAGITRTDCIPEPGTQDSEAMQAAAGMLGFAEETCKRMQRQICYGETDDYCGYQDFLDTCGGALQQIAKDQRRRHGFGR